METMERRAIVVTGAARGIGLATAERFAAAGDDLVVNDLSFPDEAKRRLERTASEAGGTVTFVTGDISDPLVAPATIGACVEKRGRVDVLVNNAGLLRAKASHEVEWDEWQRVIDVNLGGTWRMIRAALPPKIARRQGRIINVSSELGLAGYACYAAYSASKGGVIALTKALAKEYASYGILINSVAPGPVETDLLRVDSMEFTDEAREAVPLKRFGRPEEIARSIEFLAGPGGDFYVGQVISPNGGVVM